MKSEKERLQELDCEPFYFKFFTGTKMPINPGFTQIIMFDDIFSVETEEGKRENIEDINIIEAVKELILSNIKNFEIMEVSIGDAVKSSYNHNFSFKINDISFAINRNILKEEVKNTYDIFERELMDIIDVDKYI